LKANFDIFLKALYNKFLERRLSNL